MELQHRIGGVVRVELQHRIGGVVRGGATA